VLAPGKVEEAFRRNGIGVVRESEPHEDGAPPHTEIPASADGLPIDGDPDIAPPAPTKASPLRLTYFDECGAFTQKRWILKGIIARGETSAWIAPPGAGKSALLTEISVHCAGRIDWRGHRAKEACGVVIFALERGDLLKRRLQVYRQRDNLHGLPIAIADAVIDLLNPNCVDTIVSTVREAEQRFGRRVGLIGFDTYAKGIAANGGDEDKARDQNRAAANLRNVHARLEVHIALVGHTGKDESRGARGSNAHLGDVDVMVQISGDAIKVAQVIKGNDQPERVVAEFKMELYETGRDEDGEPVTTSIVSTEHFDASLATTNPRSKEKKVKLPPIPKAALQALHECIADGPAPTHARVPAGVTGVTLTQWRDRLQKLAIINADGSYREQFKRIRVTLQNAKIIGIWEDFVWPVT
jgi:AAA domain